MRDTTVENYFDGDDYYLEYYDTTLTDVEFNILNFLLDVTKNDKVYVYIENNSQSSKRYWYVKSVNHYEEIREFQVYSNFGMYWKTWIIKDLTKNIFERNDIDVNF